VNAFWLGLKASYLKVYWLWLGLLHRWFTLYIARLRRKSKKSFRINGQGEKKKKKKKKRIYLVSISLLIIISRFE
jgi:hypothetical protein